MFNWKSFVHSTDYEIDNEEQLQLETFQVEVCTSIGKFGRIEKTLEKIATGPKNYDLPLIDVRVLRSALSALR